MNSMSILVVAAACLAALPSVWGHAALVSPIAYNANPSKSFRCGGVTAGPLNYIPGDGPHTFSWKLIAGDGAGMVRMLVDTTGSAANFPTDYSIAPTNTVVNVDVSGTAPATVGVTYDFTYTLPAGLTCTGSAGGSTQVCTVQITSTSNWVACFAFSKEAGPAGGGGSTATQQQFYGSCVTAPAGLASCPMIQGQKVWVPTGGDVLDMDASVTATLNQNLPNPNVFVKAQAATDVTPCSTSYRYFLCAQTFIPCVTSGTGANTQPQQGVLAQPCHSTCQEFTCWCQLNALHADLYRCDMNNANNDITGRCNVKFGPANTTCIPPAISSTGPNCYNGLCAAAPHTASAAPALLIGAIAIAVAALVARN